MSSDEVRHGRYVRLNGTEYKVVSKGGWALWSPTPAPGFEKRGGSGFVRAVRPGERLECFRITNRGTYRGIPVEVLPSSAGRVMMVTRDARARDAGFDTLDRHDLVKVVPRSDRELRFTTTKTPEPGPWMAR